MCVPWTGRCCTCYFSCENVGWRSGLKCKKRITLGDETAVRKLWIVIINCCFKHNINYVLKIRTERDTNVNKIACNLVE
jgi:hypothetical protein